MTDLTAEQKQARYAASRPKLGEERYRMEDFRIVFRDGTEKTERAIGFSQIAALYPDAVRLERCDWGGFY